MMENCVKTDFFSIEEQDNHFVIRRKKAPKKNIYILIGLAFLYSTIFFFYEDGTYSYFHLLGILYSIGSLIWFLRIKEIEIIKKQDIKSLKMKNGLFNFNTTLIIALHNDRKIRLYCQNEKNTKRVKFLLESPIRIV